IRAGTTTCSGRESPARPRRLHRKRNDRHDRARRGPGARGQSIAVGFAGHSKGDPMPRRRNQSLRGRADQAGILFATANAPLGFQRTLMPRALMDQALITGLSASTNHALVSLVQDSIQAAALVFVGDAARRDLDERRWSRATIAADVAAIGAGIAIQQLFRQR